MRKERAVETDLSNAKVVRYEGTWDGGNSSRLGVRERAGEDFQTIYYDGSRGVKWSEETLANTCDVTILEEFPSSPLEEVVGDAPVFLAMDKQGVRWSFSRFPHTGSGSFIPVRISPYIWHTKLAFDESLGYCEADIADKIDMSTVQPLFPRE